jgi:Fe-S-cluster containining protein
MTDEPEPAEQDLPAGDFSAWLDGMQSALRGEGDSDVPCAGCTACCTSSQFVHIEPDEADTLAHIPPELLFPAPRMPRGHVLLGYDEHGHCPMLIDNRCSIYEHRPRACRTYDCRIFAATGVAVDDDKPEIARRVRRWRFTYPTDADRTRQIALRAAAGASRSDMTNTQIAVQAIEETQHRRR